MNSARPRTNYLILAAYVLAVLLAGLAIYYFGGGTEDPPGDGNPQLLDRSIEPEPRDGPSPDFSQQAPSRDGGDRIGPAGS